MKFYIILFLVVFSSTNIMAQNIVLVQYKEFVNSDFSFNMNEFLYIDVEKNATLYLIDYVNQEDEGLSEEMSQKIAQADAYVEPGRQDDSIYDFIKIDHAHKEIALYEDFYKRFFKINDSYPDLQWELLPEKKIVDGLACKKAITKYRGKTWEAWYAPSIALPYGPWKLHGLPGIIVEASDSEKRFNYRMMSINYDVEKIPEIPINRVNRVLSIKEFLLFQDDFFNNRPSERGWIDISPVTNITEKSREKEYEFDIEFSYQKK